MRRSRSAGERREVTSDHPVVSQTERKQFRSIFNMQRFYRPCNAR